MGISILELMTGKTKKDKFLVSLEGLPGVWARMEESGGIIQVLGMLLGGGKTGKDVEKVLGDVIQIIGKNYSYYFDESYQSPATPLPLPDENKNLSFSLNNRAVFKYLQHLYEPALSLSAKACQLYTPNIEAFLN